MSWWEQLCCHLIREMPVTYSFTLKVRNLEDNGLGDVPIWKRQLTKHTSFGAVNNSPIFAQRIHLFVPFQVITFSLHRRVLWRRHSLSSLFRDNAWKQIHASQKSRWSKNVFVIKATERHWWTALRIRVGCE